jgi:hypothetical protein
MPSNLTATVEGASQMRLFVLYDQGGRIVAATRLDPHARFEPALPKAEPGQSRAELELPAEYAHFTFAQACRQMMVDTTGDTPRLIARPAGSPDPRRGLTRNG